MAEINEFTFDPKEIAKLMVREQGITSGHWEIGTTLTFTALNAAVNEGPTLPAVVIQIAKITLRRVAQPTLLSIDAESLNEFPAAIEVK